MLWLASSTFGLVKVVTDGGNRVLHTDTFVFRVGQHTCYEIYTMAWDGHDTLYIGCRGGIGIIRFNLNDCTYSPLRNINEKIPGIGDIISLAYTSDGTLYFGSSIGGGIVDCSDPENPRLTKVLTSSDGMANDMVHSIIPDIASGNVWLSTNKGLARYNTATGVLHNTTGIAGDINEFCDNSGYISPQSGNLIFGALNGIVCVKKDAPLIPAADSGLPAPEVVLTGLTVNGVDMLPDYGRLEGNLEFNYNDDVISISFAALDYITGDYINYWYQLEGVSDKWINLGTSPTVTLSNLPPGSYTLRVRCENDGERALRERRRKCRTQDLRAPLQGQSGMVRHMTTHGTATPSVCCSSPASSTSSTPARAASTPKSAANSSCASTSRSRSASTPTARSFSPISPTNFARRSP